MPGWITCFGTYSSVVCAKSPERARPLFAYQTIIVREARHCEGTGWQLYDSTFCHQVAGKPNVDWSVLNASFYSTSFLANQNNRGRTCKHCLETDHVFTNCALAPLSGDKQSRGKKRDYDPPQNTGRHLIRGRGESREHASHGTMAAFLSHTATGGMFVEDVDPRTIVSHYVPQDKGPQGVCQMSVPAPTRSQGDDGAGC